MFAGLRSFAQNLANAFMETEVTIQNRSTFGKDPTNPNGDDVVELEGTIVTVKGWMTSSLTKSIDAVGGMNTVVENDTIRLPVGTDVRPGAKLTFNGHDWTALDSSDDETWPAMLKVSITRISG